MNNRLITPQQHAILRHCLGFNMAPRSLKLHRNYYCSHAGQDDFGHVRELVRAGYMEPEKGQCYRATTAGIVVGRLSYEEYGAMVGVLKGKEVEGG